ncbi:acyltransferase family protein [Massilia sp. DD77]|uniref:acyltransferase family protein n=1 Tax=Massilia sp. DD77 TaxID=3109349 RepID=UPI0030007544
MTKHIPYLDGWRGLAIVCLLIGHFFPVPAINLGVVGVALFFVLSGLLMARVLFVQRTDFGTFYRRRIARVFPSVAVYLAVMTAIWTLSGQGFSEVELLAAMTFTNNYIGVELGAMPFGHIWSLSVEEHSYVILSLAAYWCRARGHRGLSAMALILAVILGAIAVYSFVPAAHNSRFSLRTEVASFGIFASGFVFLALAGKSIRWNTAWIAPAALLVGVAAHWWSVPTGLRIIVGWGAFALAVNFMAAAPGWFIALFESIWLRRLGVYSFSLYLWQQPFYLLSRHSGLPPVLGFACSLLVGWAAFHLVENPARVYLNKRWGARPRPVIDSEAESECVRS